MEPDEGTPEQYQHAEAQILPAFQRDLRQLLDGRPDPQVQESDDRAVYAFAVKAVRQYHNATARNPELPRLSRAQYLTIEQRLYLTHTRLGPAGPYLTQDDVEDVIIYGAESGYMECGNRRLPLPQQFQTEEELILMVRYYAEQAGTHFDVSNPMVTLTLPDGSRLNAMMPPVCEPLQVAIRRQQFGRFSSLDSLVHERAMSAAVAALLRAAVKARLNIVIVGSTGSGKTTLARVLALQIPEGERIAVLETERELFLHRLRPGDFFSLAERDANVEGAGRVTLRDLFARGALRQRPRRIIVGEVRGDEALDMLHAMASDHDGSLSTMHGSGARMALNRLQMLAMAAGANLPQPLISQMIGTAIDCVIHLGQLTRRDEDVRRLMSISLVDHNPDGDDPVVQEVCRYREADDTWRWDTDALRFMPTKIANKLQMAGEGDVYKLTDRVTGRPDDP